MFSIFEQVIPVKPGLEQFTLRGLLSLNCLKPGYIV